jgi:nitrogenase molybdenum-iron protein alpha/beta subunit
MEARCATDELIKSRDYEEEIKCLQGKNVLLVDELNSLNDWAIECRDKVLYPLSHQDNDLGKFAEGMGQAYSSINERLKDILLERKEKFHD